MSNEFDFNSGEGGGAGGGDQAEESSAELSELALGPEKSNAGRNTAMILMTFAAVGAATIYFMRLKSGPQSVAAAPPKETLQASNTILKFLKEGSAKDFKKLLDDTGEFIELFKDKGTVVQVSSERLFAKGNPFQHKQPDAEDLEAERKKAEEEAKAKAEAARKVAYKDAEVDFKKLKLSFIMGGAKGRTCMINGVAYKAGGVVEDFVITDIQPNSVTLVRKIPGYEDFTGKLTTGK